MYIKEVGEIVIVNEAFAFANGLKIIGKGPSIISLGNKAIP